MSSPAMTADDARVESLRGLPPHPRADGGEDRGAVAPPHPEEPRRARRLEGCGGPRHSHPVIPAKLVPT